MAQPISAATLERNPLGGGAPANPMGHILIRQPYTLDLGNLRIAVLDTANACDEHDPSYTTSTYRTQLATLTGEMQGGTPTWLMGHRPIWGIYEPSSNVPGGNGFESSGLFNALPPTLPSSWKLAVSGHMHRFQSVDLESGFSGHHPQQIVVGNSGVALGVTGDEQIKSTYDNNPKTEILGLQIGQFGFLDVELNGSDWSGKMKDSGGNVLACCGSSSSGVCSLGPCKTP